MKKIILIILIIAVLVLTGCQSNKNNQPDQNVNIPSQSITPAQKVDVYGDAKTFGSKDLGWEIKFTEPYQKIDCAECIGGTYLLFGPIKPEPTIDVNANSQAPAYTLGFAETKSVNNEFDIIKANATMPETVIKKKVGDFDVISWKDGGECENRLMEVFGAKYNIVLSSLGCATTEQEDFNYFEDTVKNIIKLD